MGFLKLSNISALVLILFLFCYTRANGTFTFCSTPPCDPQLLILADIANSFKNTIELASYWNLTEEQEYCFWPCTVCDVFHNITTINLHNMSLMGTISPSFSNLTALNFLYLDINNLTGQVPQSLTKLTRLRYFDISNNNLSGHLPKFSASIEVTIDGNPLLEDNSTTMPPISSMPPITSRGPAGNRGDDGQNGNRKMGRSLAKVIGIIVGGVFCVVVAFIISVIFFKRHGHGVHFNPNQAENVVFSIQLLREATNNFDEHNIIGRGGSGVVYRGELQDGTKIAIKRMDSIAIESRGLNEFDAEVDVLTHVRHRHLVNLLAHCVHGNHMFLVYEYMSQGTLTQHLFNWQQNGYPALTWKERIIIALDVGRGVQYLHSLAHQSFIHRDLKPSNILLNDDLRAKIADFGLVRRAPEGLSVETRVAGTFGYIAPEYARSGRATTKVDVYAFGAILMEMVTGRKALDNSLGEEEAHLVTWLHGLLEQNQNIKNLIDPAVNPDEETMESIEKVIELARQCTVHDRHQRPDMNHVVNVLGSLVHQWTPTIPNEDEEEDEETHLHMTLFQIWQAEDGTSSTSEIESH